VERCAGKDNQVLTEASFTSSFVALPRSSAGTTASRAAATRDACVQNRGSAQPIGSGAPAPRLKLALAR
jgi:hypothetical protein